MQFGTHEFGAALFHFDNSFLSNSVLARPKFGNDDTDRVRRNRRSYGGLGNTNDFRSFTLTLDGDAFPNLPGLNYHLGYSHLARGATETDSEEGFVGALQWAFDVGHGLTLTPLVELAHFRHFAGGADKATYLTTALQADWGDWTFVAARTQRHIDEPSAGSTFGYDYTDSLFSLLAGYTFDFGLEASVGWKREQVEGSSLLHAIGFRLGYEIKI